MAFQATLKALESAGASANDIDFILFATCSGDYLLPNCASILQDKLKITNQCGALDIAAACSGFVYGFNMADAMIKTGMSKLVLVVGAEMLSSYLNWQDRTSCILFGDGCGVALLGASDDESQVLSSILAADGSGKEFIKINAGGTAQPHNQESISSADRFISMQGREMFKVATRTLAENGRQAVEAAGLTLSDIDWVVPHQANVRIVETAAKRLDIPSEKILMNIEKFGNTSAATIPTVFDEGIRQNKIKRGHHVLFITFGAGLTSGATVIRY